MSVLLLSALLLSLTAIPPTDAKGSTSTTYNGGGYRASKSGYYSRRATVVVAPYWRPRGTYYYGYRTTPSSCGRCSSFSSTYFCPDDGMCYSYSYKCTSRCLQTCVVSGASCGSYVPRSQSYSTVPSDNLRCRRDVDIYYVPLANASMPYAPPTTTATALQDERGDPIGYASPTAYPWLSVPWTQLLVESTRYCYDDNSEDIYSPLNRLLTDMVRDQVVFQFNGVTRHGMIMEPYVPPTITMFLKKRLFDDKPAWTVTVRILNMFTYVTVDGKGMPSSRTATVDFTTPSNVSLGVVSYTMSMVDATRVRTVQSIWNYATSTGRNGMISLTCSIPDDFAQTTSTPARFYFPPALSCDIAVTGLSPNASSSLRERIGFTFEISSPSHFTKAGRQRTESPVEVVEATPDDTTPDDTTPDDTTDDGTTKNRRQMSPSAAPVVSNDEMVPTLDPRTMERIEIGTAANFLDGERSFIAFGTPLIPTSSFGASDLTFAPRTPGGILDVAGSRDPQTSTADDDVNRVVVGAATRDASAITFRFFVAWDDPNSKMDLDAAVPAAGVSLLALVVGVIVLVL